MFFSNFCIELYFQFFLSLLKLDYKSFKKFEARLEPIAHLAHTQNYNCIYINYEIEDRK